MYVTKDEQFPSRWTEVSFDSNLNKEFQKSFNDKSNESNEQEKDINLDDILVNELGQFGPYQARNIVLVTFAIVTSAFYGDFLFTTADVPHRCAIPECGEVSKNELFLPEWLHNAVPQTAAGFSRCERFAPQPFNASGGDCPAELFDRSRTVPCDSYIYAHRNTMVYDFDLGCQDWLRVMYGTVLSIGALIAFPVSGIISDRFGRRTVLVICGCLGAFTGVLRVFSINYPMAVAFQFLWAVVGSGSFTASYIIATELVGPKYRVITGATSSSLFALGEVILGGIAWLVRPWRYLMLSLNVPCFLIVMYYWLLPESVRWLLSKRQYTKAKEVLDQVAKVNGKQLSEKTINALTNPREEKAKKQNQKNTKLVTRIGHNPVLLRRVLIVPLWWVATIFVYYGLSYNSVGLSDTIYLNYILTCLIEIPGFFTAAFLLYKVGRKTTLFCGFATVAVCLFAFGFISKELQLVRLVLFLAAKFSISGVMTSVYLYTSELYPTECRHTLLTFSSTIGRFGSLLAPLTPALVKYWQGLPCALFGGAAALAGSLVLTQPETWGTQLPDTLSQAAALGQPPPARETSGL